MLISNSDDTFDPSMVTPSSGDGGPNGNTVTLLDALLGRHR
jgi:hypothetical protein